MTMSPETLKNIVEELNEDLTGGIVSKVSQPDERNMVLKVFARGRDVRLLISTHPRFSRIHTTGRKFVAPKLPLRFCAMLRSRIEDARITGLSQVAGEKIVNISLRKGGTEFTLAAELTGKSSNIILLDSGGVVLDSLRHYAPLTSPRAVIPGIKLSPLPPRTVAAREPSVPKEETETWNEAVDRFYSSLAEEEEFTLERSRIGRKIREVEKRLRRKLENLKGDGLKAEKELGFSKSGELLVSNFWKLKKGMKEIVLEDLTKIPPEKVAVPLDESLAPKENVERYFKRAKKARVALSLLKQRIPEVERELEYIGSLMYEWENANTREDLRDLEMELVAAGYEKKPPEKIRAEKAEPLRRMRTADGFEVLCGKSGIGNDLVVRKYSARGDIWLHARGVPGSHVLIKASGKTVTEKALLQGAALAAFHSKAGGAKKVEVVYADAENVRKPKGAKPGMVTVKEYKTVVVEPKEL